MNTIDWKLSFKNLPIIPEAKRWRNNKTLEQIISWKLVTGQRTTALEQDIFKSLSVFYKNLFEELKVVNYQQFTDQDFIDFTNYLHYAFNYVVFITNQYEIRRVFRLVVNESVTGGNSRITNSKYLKHPPLNVVKNTNRYNRANSPNTNVFYGTETIDTALKELRPPKDKLVSVGVWQPISNRRFTTYPISHADKAMPVNVDVRSVTNAFEEQMKNNDSLLRDFLEPYLKLLGKEFSKEVNHHYEYIASALFSERIFKDRGMRDKDFDVECIIYPSVGNQFKTSNLAILPSVIDNEFRLVEVIEFEVEEPYYNNKSLATHPAHISLAKIRNPFVTRNIAADGTIQWN